MILVPIAVSLCEVGAVVFAALAGGVLGYALRGKEHAAIAEAEMFGQSLEKKALGKVQAGVNKL